MKLSVLSLNLTVIKYKSVFSKRKASFTTIFFTNLNRNTKKKLKDVDATENV